MESMNNNVSSVNEERLLNRVLLVSSGQGGMAIANEIMSTAKSTEFTNMTEFKLVGIISSATDLIKVKNNPNVSGVINIAPEGGGAGADRVTARGMVDRSDAVTMLTDIINSNVYDMIVYVATAGGGTGSGSIPYIARQMSDIFIDIPMVIIAAVPEMNTRVGEARAIENAVWFGQEVVELIENDDTRLGVAICQTNNTDYGINAGYRATNKAIAENFILTLNAFETSKDRSESDSIDAGDLDRLVGWGGAWGWFHNPSIDLTDLRDEEVSDEFLVRLIEEHPWFLVEGGDARPNIMIVATIPEELEAPMRAASDYLNEYLGTGGTNRIAYVKPQDGEAPSVSIMVTDTSMPVQWIQDGAVILADQEAKRQATKKKLGTVNKLTRKLGRTAEESRTPRRRSAATPTGGQGGFVRNRSAETATVGSSQETA